MIMPVTIEVHFRRRGRGAHKQMCRGQGAQLPHGRVPRIARLMALAIRFDELVRSGQVTDYAELARLGHVSRARITQIMNLRLLAPDLQEELLFLPRIERGREAVHLRQLQPIAAVPDWRQQRRMWTDMGGMSQ
jgi:hypothetical protein